MKTTIFAAVALLIAAAPASAEPGKGKGRGGDHGRSHAESSEHGHHSGHDYDDDTVTIRIGGNDRDIIANFLRTENTRHCPPGLAKKNNGCLPPGLAKKYAVGSVLPPDVAILPLPRDLLDLLGTPPRGHQYVQVDKDILLIGEASKKVIDAVTLLSAVGE
jgi:hypothetical protein